MRPGTIAIGLAAGLAFLAVSCASTKDVGSAEEYYSLGIAYLDMEKYEEAKRWLTKAAASETTRRAAQYNLGRIAYETGAFGESAAMFERLLQEDPDNIVLLKAAAYARLKTADLQVAEKWYRRVVELAPDGTDAAYNFALVLFALQHYTEAEAVLSVQTAAGDQNDRAALLLLARTQKALGKVEAIDQYEKWLLDGTEAKVLAEYAEALEAASYYARALETYRQIQAPAGQDAGGPDAAELHFRIARLLLIAGSEGDQGIQELTQAVEAGFKDTDLLAELTRDQRIPEERRSEIQSMIDALAASTGAAAAAE